MTANPALLLPLALGFAAVAAVGLLIWLFPPSALLSGPRERCPSCDSKDIRPSMTQKIPDHLRGYFHLRPYRCRACWSRFFAKEQPKTDKSLNVPDQKFA